MTTPILSLQGYGVAFGERVILSSLALEINDRQITTLLGPAGTGKSTLLRTLAGFNDANPSLRTWGRATYLGEELNQVGRPALVSQSAQLMMSSVLQNLVQELPERHTLTPFQQRELAQRLLSGAGLDSLVDRLDEQVVRLPLAIQRHLAILRLTATGARLLCIDEPTTGLERDEAHRLLDYIRKESANRAIVVVLHSQEQARHMAGEIALLAGGMIQEIRPNSAFFEEPESKAGKQFVQHGTCCVPAPDADPKTLDEAILPPPPLPKEATTFVSDAFGPRGFLWLKKGSLAGTPRPGIFLDMDYDLKSLRRVGINTLISLTQTPVDPEVLKSHGIKSLRFPIIDMQAPDYAFAVDICEHIEVLLGQGEVIAVHCRAGLGRTGTVLAAYLIWEGKSALTALEQVRRVEPRWVQSQEQVAFLDDFAAQLADNRAERGCSGGDSNPTASNQ
ncbi:phosphatase domain-containing putative toxin [Thiohalomonas denitrificans]|uniref:Atypical dual specificity phosphatase n=1 Tax=Thiohalomonas denitrificans TaxID=415747 RepID=A0A1G5QBN8_9GAMM|nr:ATP-binding cassette domain-containing protein [Thiohalomonas denitrificans]SCZ59295.1 atypical dual specificity phosphatase [Thiohalomonas denitrificans]